MFTLLFSPTALAAQSFVVMCERERACGCERRRRRPSARSSRLLLLLLLGAPCGQSRARMGGHAGCRHPNCSFSDGLQLHTTCPRAHRQVARAETRAVVLSFVVVAFLVFLRFCL
jgi:hypothetical protein